MKTINTSKRSYMYYVAFSIMVISMSIFAFSDTALADDWSDVSYIDYTGIGESEWTNISDDFDTWTDVDYSNYTGIGDAGDGCCDVATYATADNTVWTDVDYSNYTGIGDAGDGCCDVATYQETTATNYIPETIAYTGDYEYTTYNPVTYTYNPVTYTPRTYSSPTYTYIPSTYTYTPITYSSPTYTYPPITYTTVDTPSCDSFTASDYNVDDNDTITLTWRTSDATTVSINNGVGTVDRDGTKRVTITEDITYRLTASDGKESVHCSVTIEIDDEEDEDEDEDPDTRAPHCELTVSDKSIEEGDEVKLSWDNLRTDDIVIRDNHGETLVNTNSSSKYDADKDSITIEPDETTTYTLTAENGSREDKCTVKVTVDEDKKTTKSSETPRCVFTVSDTNISRGERVTLSWKNERTDSLIIKDNHGKEIVDSKDDKKIDEDQDGIVIQPTQSTTYTLTVKNGSKNRDCTVKVTVGGDVSVTSIRTQDGIPLNQVPYTGFDASDMLVIIFYGAGGLWASIMGYGFWMKKKAALEVVDIIG